MTRTFTPAALASTAQSMAAMASSTLPWPSSPMNRRPMRLVVQLNPAAPAWLLPTSPTTSATKVPCDPSVLMGSQVSVVTS